MALNKNAKKWVKALRSRKYKQTTRKLSQGGKFCCLGVACELAVEAGVISAPRNNIYDDQGAWLPAKVMDWLGLAHHRGKYTDSHGDNTTLTALNDSRRYSFSKIARVIESEPKGLFK